MDFRIRQCLILVATQKPGDSRFQNICKYMPAQLPEIPDHVRYLTHAHLINHGACSQKESFSGVTSFGIIQYVVMANVTNDRQVHHLPNVDGFVCRSAPPRSKFWLPIFCPPKLHTVAEFVLSPLLFFIYFLTSCSFNLAC